MIFFISNGRLGNQIFQFAFLNTIAKDGEKVICINMTEFFKYFQINNNNYVNLIVPRLFIHFFSKPFSKLIAFLVWLRIFGSLEQLRKNNVPQPRTVESKGILPITFVRTGFFQSDQLFSKEKIDFDIKKKYQLQAKKILDKLPDCEKVFVHVRRGDYVNEIYRGQRGITLPKKYYTKAMKEIEKSIKTPFYIFLTDDPGYVEDAFDDIDNKYISKESMATDFAIMGLCENGIASNSSFSWWGSYFSNNKKLMIFPKYWYGWKTNFNSHPGITPAWATSIDVL